jgi:uncharacterized protein with PQ loop repeat
MDINTIGYLGAILLAFCALPQAIMSIINGHSRGLSFMFLWMWYLGEMFMLQHVMATIGITGPLFWNYFINFILLTIIVWYRYFPRKEANG